MEGTTAPRKGLEIPSDALVSHLKSLGIESTDSAINIRQFKHGQSNPTYFVGFGDRRLVLRKKPPGKLLPSAHAVEREYFVMDALGKHGVPVPKMVSLCEDSRCVFYGGLDGLWWLHPFACSVQTRKKKVVPQTTRLQFLVICQSFWLSEICHNLKQLFVTNKVE